MILVIRTDETEVHPMLEGLTVGDRVRLTDRCKHSRFRTGATGRVVWVSCWGLYHVRMDRPEGPPMVSFRPGEIELDDTD